MYQIEEFKREILIRESNKCFIAMFKYSDSHWCFSLPVKSMYLSTSEDVIKSIEKMKEDNKYKCEYKIAKIIN